MRVVFFHLVGCPREDPHNGRKRCVLVVNLCCMCKRSEEFVDQLLLQCEMAMTVWNVSLAVSVSLDYDKKSSTPFHLLERGGWQSLEYDSVEGSFVLPNVVL